MTGTNCERIQELLPELASGALSAREAEEVEGHLASCPECREVLGVIGALRRAWGDAEVPAAAPPGLEARIQARVREELAAEQLGEGRGSRRKEAGVIPIFGWLHRAPAWALSAAALVILALGTSVIWNQRTPQLGLDPVVVATQEDAPEAWLWDDGMVAGAPVFDGLSDEDLEALLKEIGG